MDQYLKEGWRFHFLSYFSLIAELGMYILIKYLYTCSGLTSTKSIVLVLVVIIDR